MTLFLELQRNKPGAIFLFSSNALNIVSDLWSILTNLLWMKRVTQSDHYMDTCTTGILFCLIFHSFQSGCWLCKAEPFWTSVQHRVQQSYKHNGELRQWGCHFHFNAAVHILWLCSSIDSNYRQPTGFHLHIGWAWFWVTCYLSGAKMFSPSDQFHQLQHEVDDLDEVWCFINLTRKMNYFSSIQAPSQHFFITRRTTTPQNKRRRTVKLSFSCHFPSPAASAGGAAAINGFLSSFKWVRT